MVAASKKAGHDYNPPNRARLIEVRGINCDSSPTTDRGLGQRFSKPLPRPSCDHPPAEYLWPTRRAECTLLRDVALLGSGAAAVFSSRA